MKNLLKKPLRFIELILWSVFWITVSFIVCVVLKKLWPILFLFYIVIPISHLTCFHEPLLWHEKLNIATQYILFICVGLFIFAPESLFWLYATVAILDCSVMFFTVFLYLKK